MISITGIHDNFGKDDPKQVTWTRPMLERLKLAVTDAQTGKLETFTFDGNEFHVGYACLMIQFLEDNLSKQQ